MNWVRKNKVVTKRAYSSLRWDPEARKYVRLDPGDMKPYRSYSKWHIAHEKSQWFLGGAVISLCGTLNLPSQDVESSVDEPKKGKKGYGSSAVCSNCAMVWRAIS
jgi:hypothetical protein